jgi:hypothetical protein
MLAAATLLASCSFIESTDAKPQRASKTSVFKLPKEEKAWINGKGMCVFPFASDELPDTADGFATAMEEGYRKALKLPDTDDPVVAATGGKYPLVDSLKIDVRDAVVRHPEKNSRKPSERHLAVHGLSASRFELLAWRTSVKDARINFNMTANDARFVFTQDTDGKPLMVLDRATDGKVTIEISHDDIERLLLAAAREGSKGYGLGVERTRLDMTVENGKTILIDLRLSTRVALVPAGLRFRAQLDIDEKLNGTLSHMSCTGDDVLGPLISGLIQPFLAKYEGKTRPLMNFPSTDMRLHDLSIDSDKSIRIAAAFGN